MKKILSIVLMMFIGISAGIWLFGWLKMNTSICVPADCVVLDRSVEVTGGVATPDFVGLSVEDELLDPLWPDLTGDLSFKVGKIYDVGGNSFILLHDFRDNGKKPRLKKGEELVGLFGPWAVVGSIGYDIRSIGYGFGPGGNLYIFATPKGAFDDSGKLKVYVRPLNFYES